MTVENRLFYEGISFWWAENFGLYFCEYLLNYCYKIKNLWSLLCVRRIACWEIKFFVLCLLGGPSALVGLEECE